MGKILALWGLFKAGESVANPTAWKTGAITVSMLAPVLLKTDDVLQSFGVPLHVTDAQAGTIAAGVIALVNIVVHFIADKNMGIPTNDADKKPE